MEARGFTLFPEADFVLEIVSSSQPGSMHIQIVGNVYHRDSYTGRAIHKFGPRQSWEWQGTQCAKIVETFGFKHLSAGDLLRREIGPESEYGSTILNTIREEIMVPSQVTVKLIQKEMELRDNKKFLIDGFPRSEENRIALEKIVGAEPNVALFLECPEEEMVKRVLSRNQGRVDENIDTIKKRLKVFEALNLPVINYYSEKGK